MTDVRIGVEGKMFDNFALDCFRNCPCYYDLRINKGLVKPGAKKIAADFGTYIHLSLEHYYKSGMTDASIKEALDMFLNEYGKIDDGTDEKRSVGKGLEILGRYFSQYRHEPFNVKATEIGGAFELGEFLYTFRIDLLVEWNSPKGLYGMDHKTTSSLGRMVVKPNNQISGYDYALKQQYSNVLGYMVNAIGVYSSEEEVDKGAPKVVSQKTGKMVYAKKKREIFLRMPTTRTGSELKQWEVETIHLIHQIEDCQEKDIWPKKTGFCTAFATKCQYLDICQSQDQSIIQPLIEAEIYKEEFWQPYKGIEVEGGDGDE